MTEDEIQKLAELCILRHNDTFEADFVREFLDDSDIEYTSEDVKAIHLKMYGADVWVTW
jgi:hypothetical protein